MADFKSVLSSPTASVGVGIAALTLVFGIYNSKVGTLSAVHMTPANDGNVAAAIKKAGVTSAVVVGGLFLVTRDPNVVIMGSAGIIAEELTYRHAAMADHQSGQISVTPSDYYQAPTQYSVDQSTNYDY